MKILGIIPSRYGSTRFPGKPLIEIGGISMIQRVYQQASNAKTLAKIIIHLVENDEETMTQLLTFANLLMKLSGDQ